MFAELAYLLNDNCVRWKSSIGFVGSPTCILVDI